MSAIATPPSTTPPTRCNRCWTCTNAMRRGTCPTRPTIRRCPESRSGFNRRAIATASGTDYGVRLIRAVGDDIHGRPARLAKHEAPGAPLLVAQGIGDLEAELQRSGVDGVDIIHLDRDAGGRRVVVADDRHLGRGVGR